MRLIHTDHLNEVFESNEIMDPVHDPERLFIQHRKRCDSFPKLSMGFFLFRFY